MSVPLDAFPALTSAEMARVDRIMVDEFGLDVLQVMETAGRAIAAFARAHFLAGTGGNGGDGLVAARYLLGWGARVDVFLGRERAALGVTAAHQAAILAN